MLRLTHLPKRLTIATMKRRRLRKIVQSTATLRMVSQRESDVTLAQGMVWQGGHLFPGMGSRAVSHDVDDMILIGCVRAFPHTVLEQIFGERFELRFVHASPLQMGIPASRTRKYMCLFKKARWQWLHGASNDVFTRWYAAFFTRPCRLGGEDLLVASEQAVSQHVQQQALQRGLLKKRRIDAEWSSYLTLPPTLRQRVKDYEVVAKERDPEDENAEGAMISGVVNLNKTATYMPCVNQHIQLC